MKKFIAIIILCLLPISFGAAQTSQDFDFSSFKKLPVLHEGRIKPLDTFARLHLKELSEHENIDELTATEWLAETLFNPASAIDRPVFVIMNQDLKKYLDLPENQSLFSLPELIPALQKAQPQIGKLLQAEEKTLTAQQKHLLDLYTKVMQYNELLRSFSMSAPLEIAVPKNYKNLQPSWLGYGTAENQVLTQVKKIVRSKGNNPQHYTEEEKKLAEFAFALKEIRFGGEQSHIWRVIPTAGNNWISLWSLVLQNKSNAKDRFFKDWQDMASAYRSNNAQHWNEAVEKTAQDYRSFTSPALIQLEVLINALKPFYLALGLYILGLCLLTTNIFYKPVSIYYAVSIITAAALAHMVGIMARIFILHRPPVGTLYESVLFVSLVCSIAALIFSFRKSPQRLFLFCGILSAILLLLLAPSMLQQGESMEMLVAVLNTNFWLGTHVLCITTGYAMSILTSCLAHGYLAASITQKPKHQLLALQNAIYKTSLVALLLTAVGTILGGIWADQSWGRFWGWDPKENGALLIVLWLIWMQHGRIAGRLNIIAFMAAGSFLNVIVALSWFGVNLLNVGLHSYGFTSGLAWGLGLFCTIETILITMLWLLATKQKQSAP